MRTGVIDRQVQLVLKTHKELEYITEESQERARRPQSSRSTELVGATPRALAEEIAEWSRSRPRMVAKPATPPMADGREAGLLKTPMVVRPASPGTLEPGPPVLNPEMNPRALRRTLLMFLQ